MELFLPGLFVMLIASVFVFLVVPRVGTVALGVMSVLTLIAVLWHHSYMFKDEYRMSTWQNQLHTYAPFVVLALALLTILLVLQNMFTGKGIMETVKAPVEVIQTSMQQAISNMPSASSATNMLTSTINKAINTTKPTNTSPTSLIPALGYKASNV